MKYKIEEIENYVEGLFEGQWYAEMDYYNGHILKVVQRIKHMKDVIVADIGEQNYQIALVVAYLHDVIEDTHVTFEELKDKYGYDVASAVRLLTREKNDSYAQYLVNILVNDNKIALYVKLADLGANIEQSNIDIETKIGDKRRIASQRLDKYLLARMIVEKELNKGN